MMNDQIKKQLLDLAEQNIRSLLETHINGILSTADLDEKQKCSVSINLVVDVSNKVPAGSVKLSFAQKTVDDSMFHCDDPEQTKLRV